MIRVFRTTNLGIHLVQKYISEKQKFCFKEECFLRNQGQLGKNDDFAKIMSAKIRTQMPHMAADQQREGGRG